MTVPVTKTPLKTPLTVNVAPRDTSCIRVPCRCKGAVGLHGYHDLRVAVQVERHRRAADDPAVLRLARAAEHLSLDQPQVRCAGVDVEIRPEDHVAGHDLLDGGVLVVPGALPGQLACHRGRCSEQPDEDGHRDGGAQSADTMVRAAGDEWRAARRAPARRGAASGRPSREVSTRPGASVAEPRGARCRASLPHEARSAAADRGCAARSSCRRHRARRRGRDT